MEKDFKKKWAKKLVGGLLELSLFFTFLIYPLSYAQANIPVIDASGNALITTGNVLQGEGNAAQTIGDAGTQAAIIGAQQEDIIEEKWTDVLKTTLKLVALNALFDLLNRAAYDSAVWLASGGKGQAPMFFTDKWGEYFVDVADEAAGDFIQSLGEEFFGIDVCEVGVSFQIDLGMALRKPGRYSADCSASELVSGWGDWISDPNVMDKFIGNFDPRVNKFSIALRAFDKKQYLIGQEKEAATKDREEGEGNKALESSVSLKILTPNTATRKRLETLSEEGFTKKEDLQDWEGVFTIALSTFIDTFVSKVIKTLWNEGLAALSGGGGDGGGYNAYTGYNTASGNSYPRGSDLYSPSGSFSPYLGTQAAINRFSNIFTQDFITSGPYDVISTLSTCINPENPAPDSCVIDLRFRSAIESQMTVREAINSGFIDGNAPFGFTSQGFQPNYNQGYPYRSLIILRTYRVIPVTWELAALLIEKTSDGKQYTLNDLISEYNNQESPFYKLIDEDWVLKLPFAYCNAQGYGPLNQTGISVLNGSDSNNDGDFDDPGDKLPEENFSRTQYCADYQSCIQKDEGGNCIYGYCTEEKRTWDLQGDLCPKEFNTCQTVASRAGEVASYLRNSLDYNGCNIDNVGCNWYCREYNTIGGEWTCTNEGENVFKKCDQAGGCAIASSCQINVDESYCIDENSGSLLVVSSECTSGSKWWNSELGACVAQASCVIEKGAVSCSNDGCESLENVLLNSSFENSASPLPKNGLHYKAENWFTNEDGSPYFEQVSGSVEHIINGTRAIGFYSAGGKPGGTDQGVWLSSDKISLGTTDGLGNAKHYTVVGYVYNSLNVGQVEISVNGKESKRVLSRNKWEKISFDFEPDTDFENEIMIKVYGQQVSGSVWFDDFSVSESCLADTVTLTLAGADQKDQSKIHFDRDVQSCDPESDGCTEFINIDPDRGTNLVVNGSFEEWNNLQEVPEGWVKGTNWGSDPATSNKIERSSDAIRGSYSAKLTNSDSDVKLYRDFRTDFNLTHIQPGKTYVISFYAKTDSDLSVLGQNWYAELLWSVPSQTGDHPGVVYELVPLSDQYNIILTNEWKRFVSKPISLTSSKKAGGVPDYKFCSNDSNILCTTDDECGTSEDFCVPPNSTAPILGHNFSVSINNGNQDKSTIYLDGFQIEEVFNNVEASDYKDYGDTDLVYLKKAPSYLQCQGYTLSRPSPYVLDGVRQSACIGQNLVWKQDSCDPSGEFCCHEVDPGICNNYATYCQADEVGCELYTPVDGSPAIPGVVTYEDYCPSECVGYDSYKQTTTYFESQESLEFFIPNTAEQCNLANAGCDEFTNLDEIAAGGEGREYYKYVRHCEKPAEASCSNFYTWQGSDESGYKLVTYNLVAEGAGQPEMAVKNVNSWMDSWCDDTTPGNGGQPKCCDGPEDLLTNPFCRELYSADGSAYYRIYDNTITCSQDCHPFRKTRLGESSSEAERNCLDSNGSWESDACVYYAIPSQGLSCSSEYAGCREYRGNSGNNTFAAFGDNFEDGDTLGWNIGIISNEALTVGGHSIKSQFAVDNTNPVPGHKIVTSKADTGSFGICDPDTIPECGSGNYPCFEPAVNKCILKDTSSGDVCYANIGQTNCSLIDSLIESNKSYVISFWAKNDRVNNENLTISFIGDGVNGNLSVASASISPRWQHYSFGPFSYRGVNEFSQLKFSLPDNAQTAFYVDNILIKEITDHAYVIKNTWQTPISCDTNPFVDPAIPAPQFMLGCKQYIDRNTTIHNLKSFDHLCRDSVVGCSDMIDTQNSSSPFAQSFNIGDEIGQVDIESDNIVYIVNRPEFNCLESQKGCQRVGSPEINRDGKIVNYNDVYYINNPDQYSSILCADEEVGCEEFQTSNSFVYFKDPGDKQCEYREIPGGNGFGWFKTESTSQSPDCPVVESPLGILHPDSNSDWVGLCPDVYNGCTEFVDSTSSIGKNILFNSDFFQDTDQDKIPDGWLNPETSGGIMTIYQTLYLKNNEAYTLAFNGKRALNSKGNQVQIDVVDCPGIISFDNSMSSSNSSSVSIPSDSYFRDWDNRSDLPEVRQYSGRFHVSSNLPVDQLCRLKISFPAGVDYLAVKNYIDQINVRETGVYYYINDTKIDKKSCNGIVNEGQNCILINDRSGINYRLGETDNSYLSFDGDVSWGSINNGIPYSQCAGACDSNIIVKARPDRTCGEWLACKTKIKTIDSSGKEKDYCLDIAACNSLDVKGSCDNFVSEERQIIGANLLESGQRSKNLTTERSNNELLENLSGYVYAGTSINGQYNSNDTIRGYYPYSLMTQIGFLTETPNGNFEEFYPGGQPIGWLSPGGEYNKLQFRVIADPITAKEKEGISIKEGRSVLKVNADSEAVSEVFDVFSNTDYVLSASINTLNLKPDNAFGIIGITPINNVPFANGQLEQEIRLESGQDWTNVVKKFNTGEVTRISISLKSLQITQEKSGSVYFDEIGVRPALEVQSPTSVDRDQDGQVDQFNYINSTCRLYPEANSISCDYFDSSYSRHRGLLGYCMISDPNNPEVCLQWWPVDLIKDDFFELYPGYNDRVPLYYCLEASEGYSEFVGCLQNPEGEITLEKESLPNGSVNNLGGPICNDGFRVGRPIRESRTDWITYTLREDQQLQTWQMDEISLFMSFSHCRHGHCGGHHGYGWVTFPQTIFSSDNHEVADVNGRVKARLIVDNETGFVREVGIKSATGLYCPCPDTTVVIKKREPWCKVVVQTVTSTGQNRAWLSRVLEGSSYIVPDLNYKYEMDYKPFGAIVPPEPVDDPRAWDSNSEISGIQPLGIVEANAEDFSEPYQVRGGTPYSCETISGNNCPFPMPGQYPWGQIPIKSTDGVCSSDISKRCDPLNSTTWSRDCGSGYCISEGSERLKRLFAQTYGAWEFSSEGECSEGLNDQSPATAACDCPQSQCAEVNLGAACQGGLTPGASCDISISGSDPNCRWPGSDGTINTTCSISSDCMVCSPGENASPNSTDWNLDDRDTWQHFCDVDGSTACAPKCDDGSGIEEDCLDGSGNWKSKFRDGVKVKAGVFERWDVSSCSPRDNECRSPGICQNNNGTGSGIPCDTTAPADSVCNFGTNETCRPNTSDKYCMNKLPVNSSGIICCPGGTCTEQKKGVCEDGPAEGFPCEERKNCTTTGAVCVGDLRYEISTNKTNFWTPPNQLCVGNLRPAWLNSRGDWCGVAPVITEISVNPSKIVTPNGFGRVNLSFNVTVNPEQLPLKSYKVAWGDGEDISVTGITLRDRTNRNQPYLLSHSYSYYDLFVNNTAADLSDQIVCFDDNDIPDGLILEENQCAVVPKLKVIDNWGWCNGNLDVASGVPNSGSSWGYFTNPPATCSDTGVSCDPTDESPCNSGASCRYGTVNCSDDNDNSWTSLSGYIIVGLLD